MTSLTASVVVVSRERPALLCRCVRGLRLLDHPSYEIVVVADPLGLKALAQAGLDQGIKTKAMTKTNLPAARNLGFTLAAGEAVAFIEDDAVPEPTWLAQLTEPLARGEAVAAGGFVRGQNGISFQWQAWQVTRTGAEVVIPPWGEEARVFKTEPGRAPRLRTTNMAIRRDTFAELGGFDAAFQVGFEDVDLCLRIAERSLSIAIVPLAQVHQGQTSGPRQRSGKLAENLSVAGENLAVFLRKHAPETTSKAIAAARRTERLRLIGLMVDGWIEPRDVATILTTFDTGVSEGMRCLLAPLGELAYWAESGLQAYSSPQGEGRAIAGRAWRGRSLRKRAAKAAKEGESMTLFLFSFSAKPHRMRFTDGGWWEQIGGVYGRSIRKGLPFKLTTFGARVRAEMRRLAPVRPLER